LARWGKEHSLPENSIVCPYYQCDIQDDFIWRNKTVPKCMIGSYDADHRVYIYIEE
jgi:ribosomal protein S27AE